MWLVHTWQIVCLVAVCSSIFMEIFQIVRSQSAGRAAVNQGVSLFDVRLLLKVDRLVRLQSLLFTPEPFRLNLAQQPRRNAKWQKDARVESSNVLGLDRRRTFRVSSWAFEWSACVRGNHVFGWWLSLVHGLGKPTDAKDLTKSWREPRRE